jgi:hypothetical protein
VVSPSVAQCSRSGSFGAGQSAVVGCSGGAGFGVLASNGVVIVGVLPVPAGAAIEMGERLTAISGGKRMSTAFNGCALTSWCSVSTGKGGVMDRVFLTRKRSLVQTQYRPPSINVGQVARYRIAGNEPYCFTSGANGSTRSSSPSVMVLHRAVAERRCCRRGRRPTRRCHPGCRGPSGCRGLDEPWRVRRARCRERSARRSADSAGAPRHCSWCSTSPGRCPDGMSVALSTA